MTDTPTLLPTLKSSLRTPVRPTALRRLLNGLWHWFVMRQRWHHLRQLGTSPIMRLTILMPAVGYLVLLNHTVFTELSRLLGTVQQASEPEPVRLLLIYFGTFFLGLASAIFASYCPTPCRRYDNAVDYANAESSFFTANAAILKKMIYGHIDRVPASERFVNLWEIEEKLESTTNVTVDPGRRLEATYFLLDQH